MRRVQKLYLSDGSMVEAMIKRALLTDQIGNIPWVTLCPKNKLTVSFYPNFHRCSQTRIPLFFLQQSVTLPS